MSSSSTGPTHACPFSWGLALAASSLLLIGGGAIIWSSQPTDGPRPATPSDGGEVASLEKKFPARFALDSVPEGAHALHTVAYSVENGTRVVKIRVVPDGDELIVDAVTGRLLETRPSRPTAPPPMGKFAAPFSPMT
ncbi:MAG TPA: hypothetical protein VKD71_05985 [Gemmataceae bacterium]|nr:hypothetical protein [Gemmataceae bacterium]